MSADPPGSRRADEAAPTVVEAALRGARPDNAFEARLERYVLQERIGEGGMSSVHRARDVENGEQVALKIVELRHAGGPEEEELVRGRFERELRTVASLQHPNVTRVLSFGRAPGQLFLAMELVPGRTLHTLIEERGTLPIPVALEALRQLLRALEHAHARGVVHRDLKPANLMVTPDGMLKLLDFGIARAFGDATLTATGLVIGTPSFMAPEQAHGKPPDARTDLCSAGVTLLMALTGRARFAGLRPAVVLHKVGSEPVDTLFEVCPLAPPELDAFVGTLAALEPERRFASASEALAALAPFVTWTEAEGRALLARYQADPVVVVEELSGVAAAREVARADALLQRGASEPAAALALSRAALLDPSPALRKRLKALCAAAGLTLEPVDDPELAKARRALAGDPTSAPLLKHLAELCRARGDVQATAAYLSRALRVAPDDALAQAQLAALVHGAGATAPRRATTPRREAPQPAPATLSERAAPPQGMPTAAHVTIPEARARTRVSLGPLVWLAAAAAVIAVVLASLQLVVRGSSAAAAQVSSTQHEVLSRAEERATDKAQSQQLVAARAHLAAGQLSSATRQATLLLASNPSAEEALEALWIRASAAVQLGDPRTATADLTLYRQQMSPHDPRGADVERLLAKVRQTP